jgi:hypothetical protein
MRVENAQILLREQMRRASVAEAVGLIANADARA